MSASSDLATTKLATACLLGTLSTTAGIRALMSPYHYASEFGLSAYGRGSVTADGDAEPNPFALACGVRNLTFGLVQFTFAYQRNWKALGTVWICGVLAAMKDGLLVWRFGRTNRDKRRAWSHHWIPGAIMGVAGALFVWGC